MKVIRFKVNLHRKRFRIPGVDRTIDITASVVCDTFQKSFFTPALHYGLILHFNCEMKLNILFLYFFAGIVNLHICDAFQIK